MFNNRIVIAQKELFISIFNAVGKNYNDYKEIVNKYSSVFKPLAAWMLARDSDENAINDIVSHLTQYINRKKLNPANIKVSKTFVVINDQQFDDLMALIDFVHGNFPIAKKQEERVEQSETNHTPVLTGDGIKVFKVEKALDSKQLAADTSWCIAYQGANNMWQSYRSNQAATFYIVWDENPPTPNQRKVALQFNNNNVQITDIPNRTGSNLSNEISFEYEGKMITGRDIPTYLTYLKSKGVNIDATTTNPETGQEEKVLKNKPITPEEKLETGLGNYVKSFHNINVDDIKSWSTGKFELRPYSKDGFIKDNGDNTYSPSAGGHIGKSIEIPEEMIVEKTHLGKSAGVLPSESMSHLLESLTIESESVKTYLSKFIGMGWIMPDDIFEYLFDVPGGKDYLVQYVNTGLELPRTQIEKIQTDKQLFNSYVKQQLTAWEMNHNQGDVLQYLDPNDAKDKEKVLKAFSKTKSTNRIPDNWKENVPQIGISVADIDDDLNFSDPLAEKLAIAKGLYKVYQKNPTLENTRIFLHTPEAIEPMKPLAGANGYNDDVLKSPSNYHDFAYKWKFVPDEFKNLPEFYEISKIGQVLGDNRYNLISEFKSKNESDLTRDDFETGMVISFATAWDFEDTPIGNSAKFWNYLYDNYEKYFSGRFDRVFKEKRDIPDDVDEDDDDFDETEYPTYDEPTEQKWMIDVKLRNIPKNLLLDSNMREKFLSRFNTKILVSKLTDSPYSQDCINLAAEYVNSIQDLPISYTFAGYLTYNKNPITEKILKISGLDEYNKYMTKWRSQLDIRDYARLLNFYPFVGDQITDQMLLANWAKMNLINSTEKLETFRNLVNARPEFFRNHWQELDLWPVWISELRERNIIGTQTPQPIQERPDNNSALPEIDDQEVLASVKSMLKIAQKLDFKKEYRLADKLTYILTKKI